MIADSHCNITYIVWFKLPVVAGVFGNAAGFYFVAVDNINDGVVGFGSFKSCFIFCSKVYIFFSLFADLTSLPPLFIYVSDTEMLLDDSVRLAEHAKQCGVQVKLTIEKSQPHVWPIFVKLIPEATATLQEIAQHIRQA